ncbi:condensation domain-containing protein [Chitinophaga varians]|uniref:condensation domain-containing protein n=1 Tax=Chitinophaga varians TaxID=2202339 RepID=UPI00165ED104|nr:condensation domain-containing protein [Chitinophaga varians]MBC9913413.1 hypothetical protein [Chitinophaga varians]
MDETINNSSEPSIGQIEYLKYLQAMSAVQKPSFILTELELPQMDITVAEKTVQYFIQRHDSLRTVFPLVDNEVRQVVLPVSDTRFRLEYITVAGDIETAPIRKKCFDRAAETFANIEKGPLFKMFIFRGNGTNLFSFLIHHIICDEWSDKLIRQELAVIYAAFLTGQEPVLPPVKVKLKDYCERQNRWLREQQGMLSQFWKNKLASFDTMFDADIFRKSYRQRHPQAGIRLNDRPSLAAVELSAILDRPDASAYRSTITGPVFEQMRQIAFAGKYTVPSFVYAALALLLYAYTGQKKVLIPALVADRFERDYHQLIGCLLGSVYLPLAINEDETIDDFVNNVHQEIFMLITEGKLIFSHNFLSLEGDKLRNCCDLYVNYFRKGEDIPDSLQPDGQHHPVNAIHYPIYCMITEHDNGLVFNWKYNQYIFEPPMIEDIAACFDALVTKAVSDVQQTVGQFRRLSQPASQYS